MEYTTIIDQPISEEIKKSTLNQVRIKSVTDEGSFYELAEIWNQLTKLANAPVYLTHEWLYTWWIHFGRHPKRSLFIITIYQNGNLIGVAPFFLGVSSLGPVTIQRRLHLMGSGTSQNEMLGFTNDYGNSDFLDVIAHPEYEERVAELIVNTLMENEVGADVICFQHVSDESFVVRKILPQLEGKKLDLNKERTDECPFITLPDSLDTYLEEIGSSSRRRRFRKNLEPAGKEYQVEEISDPVRIKEGINRLCDLHQQRWIQQGYTGTFFDKRHYYFIQDMNEVAYKKGWLWFKIAKDEDGIAAMRWALKFNNRFFDCATAFDSSSPSAQHSPGLGLLAILIKDAIGMNGSRLELLRGAERYKFDFTRESRYNWRITLPLYRKESTFFSFVHPMLRSMAKFFSILQNEWKLLCVHYKKAGFIKMFYSYLNFRFDRLKSKLEQVTIFKKE